ncbi:DnaA regulatory inactivator Hda [Bermanella sp. WJH001]|uniref:DnaA regulatory inactivator Hda n=1 Tax=Bermanella sp. WJH001 TaxID=3048005 RepID=UPI0024BED142|nr:DnaA regulatory inactivator Hda [Bermanella sp. WJH001]MDJ1536971.1 DnaA regulatory inactivator Hda [Bermanella sp. WJH001]
MASIQVVEQLPLRVQLRDEATFENFYAKQDLEAVEQIKLAAQGKGEQSIYVSGQIGSGCSHLLQAACHEAQASGLNSVYLPLDELVGYSPAVFESLEDLPLIALDNLQSIAGDELWEEALFHMFNRVRDAGGRMIFAADKPLEKLGVKLPDLLSRLKWGLVYEFDDPDDEFKMGTLQLRGHNRGLEITADVAKYVVRHVNGDMEQMFEVLQQLDNASLSAQRKLTRPFVKAVMNW